MPVLWITINFFDIQSLLILIIIGVQYKINGANIFVKISTKIIAIINPVAKINFFKIIYHNIIEHLLATSFKKEGFFGFFSTYFDIMKINN